MKPATETTGAAQAAGSRSSTGASRDLDGRRLGTWLTLPAQMLVLFIAVFPLLMQLYISMTDWSPLAGVNWWMAYASWNNFANYYDLMTDNRFWSALGRTAFVMAVCVPVEFLLGLGLAVLFVDDFAGKRIFYSILLMPMMVVPAVAGYMFFMLFQSGGPVNDILSSLTGTTVTIAWLSSPGTALAAVMIADIWQWTPLMFLILLAGLVGVPEDQLKAATLLGRVMAATLFHDHAAADEDDHHHRAGHSRHREFQDLRHALHHDRRRTRRGDGNHLGLYLQGHPAGSDLELCRGHCAGHSHCLVGRSLHGHRPHEQKPAGGLT